MSLKAELETWSEALGAYDAEDFEKSLDLFGRIADSSKILVNMGLIYATLGEHELAVEQFNAATGLDQYLAVAYFQCGVSNFLLGRYDLSYKDFEEALLYLRGNQNINYEQLGLKFKLFSAEVLFNKGLSHIYLGNADEGMNDMQEAMRQKATEEHNVIDDAIKDNGEGYTVFSIPVGVLYRPNERKLKNAKTKDYLGKAKLVAASDSSDAFTTFTGVTRLKMGQTPSGAPLERPPPSPDRPTPNLTRSASANAATPSSRSDPGASGLERKPTTINVIARPTGSAPPKGSGMGGPQRGPSIARRPSETGGRGGAPRPRQPARGASGDDEDAPLPPTKQSRLTEFYDDYLDGYGGGDGDGDEPPPLPVAPAAGAGGDGRVAAWARNNATPGNAPPPAPGSATQPKPRSAPPSTYAPSSFGGGSMRRRNTRRRTQGSRAMSTYDEEEEGYQSADYEDAPFELVKIRVKLHYEDEVRGMALTPETPFDEFLERVTAKFGKSLNGLGLKFKDEDGGKVSLRDDSDYDLAIETARESAKGKPEGKLEIWCTDL